MYHIRRTAFAVLVVALPGCFKSAPVNVDEDHPTDSAAPTTSEPGDSESAVAQTTDDGVTFTDEEDSVWDLTDQTDEMGMPTDDEGSDVVAPETTDSAVTPTDDQGSSDGPSTDQTDSVESPTEWETSSEDTAAPRIPESHRKESEICDSLRDVVEPSTITEEDECASHADCTKGENGRCAWGVPDGYGLVCTYDACFTDDDCEAGKVCQCGGDQANYCLREGNCWTDADCGADGYCSPTLGSCGHYTSFVGYYCHTPEDECTNDADCSGDEYHWGAYCAYNMVSGRWMCSDAECEG